LSDVVDVSVIADVGLGRSGQPRSWTHLRRIEDSVHRGSPLFGFGFSDGSRGLEVAMGRSSGL